MNKILKVHTWGKILLESRDIHRVKILIVVIVVVIVAYTIVRRNQLVL